MWKRLQLWLEVMLAQIAILLLSWPLGIAIAAVAAVVSRLVVQSGGAGPENAGWTAVAVFFVGLPVALFLAFVLLWFLAWRFWFRLRMPVGQFLLAWIPSLILLLLLWAGWGIVVG